MGTIHVTPSGQNPPGPVREAGSGHETRGPARSATPAAPRRTAADDAAEAAPTLDSQTAEVFARQVQEALEQLAPEPHDIAFRRDEATNGFVLEIRNPDGSLVRQFPPEKLLNLRRKLDELSGMVIDEMT